jgi:transcriptional regulator with XRE-family HTH domain
MTDARAVGGRIRTHRKRIGLSQVEFAGLIGRSESWVSQVERGVRSVDRMSVLQKLADALSVPVAELRDGALTESAGQAGSRAMFRRNPDPRDPFAEMVREIWVATARELLPDPKPSWLTGWRDLDDPFQVEVDRRIGWALYMKGWSDARERR